MLILKNISQERATLDEGPVNLELPSELSAASVHDLEYWISGILRRMKRKAGIEMDDQSRVQIEQPSVRRFEGIK